MEIKSIKDHFDELRKEGVYFAQTKPFEEGIPSGIIDIRFQEEVRIAAQVALSFLDISIGFHIKPFNVSHAINQRPINGKVYDKDDPLIQDNYNTKPELLRPYLVELISRGWNEELNNNGYQFDINSGLVSTIADEKITSFDPVALVLQTPNKDNLKQKGAFNYMNSILSGGFGLDMMPFYTKIGK